MIRVPARGLLAIGVSIAASLSIAACGSQEAPNWSFPPAASPVAAAAAPGAAAPAAPAAPAPMAMTAAAHAPMAAAGAAPASTGAAAVPANDPATASPARLDLTIVTGDMIGKTEFPAYIPSDFALPAHSTVVVTITNFDDATPLAGPFAKYANVAGTVGNTMQVTPINPKAPNGAAGATRTLSGLNPNDVSHTFTIPGLGINVPVAAHARTTFTIVTGDAGTFGWRCFDPCGADPMGWGTAMAAKSGYMEGTLTVE